MLLPRLAQDVLRQPVHRDPHRAALAAQAVTGLQWHGQQIASAQAQRGAGGQGGFTGVAVASPSLGLDPCLERNPVASLTLLEHDEAGRAWLNWADWLAALGLRGARAKPRARLAFNQYDQVIFAALAGHGVALGRAPLVASMLADGRLMALRSAKTPLQPDFAYWLIQRQGGETASRRPLVDWLLAEAEGTRALVARWN